MTDVADGHVPYTALEDCIAALLRQAGMSDEHAGIVAEVLAMTDLRGVHSHGTALLTGYITRLVRGDIDPRAEPRIVHRFGAIAVLDGDNCMGHLAAVIAMREAIELAGGTGIGAVAVRGTNHCGAAGHFARLALEHGMVGVILTTALPTMAPAGGRDRVLGMNPIGVAIPAGDEPPVVLDAAFAAAARGKVVLAHQAGRPLPEGWALDRDGVPTTDPATALSGLLQPIGGIKGSGLSVVFGLLASAFAGAAFGPDLGDVEEGPVHGADGLLAIAIDPAAFDEPGAFEERVAAGASRLRASRPAPDNDQVRLPGDRAADYEAVARTSGVLLPAATRRELLELCASLDVTPPDALSAASTG
jgi:LDH2 family malate/lactate/ureidoglycolate dehydrogenase